MRALLSLLNLRRHGKFMVIELMITGETLVCTDRTVWPPMKRREVTKIVRTSNDLVVLSIADNY
jgi:hypothetical protein